MIERLRIKSLNIGELLISSNLNQLTKALVILCMHLFEELSFSLHDLLHLGLLLQGHL